jgi:lipoprotein-anchoring transpeptidase ErfK/SrfK
MRFSNLFKAALAGAFLVVFAGATANAGVRININKTTQRMDVSVDGKHRYTWKVSTGKIGYGTPSGTYKPFRMEPDHFSREWDDAPMPHSIFFTPRGHAIHGSYYTRRLGTAVSHGCVRLAPGNAAKLYSLVAREGMGNTTIVITGGFGGGLVEEFAPIGQEVKKLVPKVKREFGDWLKEVGR